jgi:hypothetical protein
MTSLNSWHRQLKEQFLRSAFGQNKHSEARNRQRFRLECLEDRVVLSNALFIPTIDSAGRFAEAVQRLTEATELSCHPYRTNMLHTWYFLAMAHQRLGHTDEARRWLEKGIRGTEEALKSPGETLGKSGNARGVISPNWNRRLTLQLLRREAEQLIQGPPTKLGK